MSIDYIFCDHCIKDITNKRQLMGKDTEFYNNNENIFCSRKCETKYNKEEDIIKRDLQLENCIYCNHLFPYARLRYFGIFGMLLCSDKCKTKKLRD
jgi:hypothetical protein